MESAFPRDIRDLCSCFARDQLSHRICLTLHPIYHLLPQTHPEALHEVAEEAGAILLKKDPGQIVGSLIQERIAEAIGNMSNPGSLLVNKLVALLDWPYGRVRRKAKQALAKLEIEPMRPTG